MAKDGKGDPGKLRDSTNYTQTFTTLEKHFEDRTTAGSGDFESAGEKTSGINAGGVVTRTSDKDKEQATRFMRKKPKTLSDAIDVNDERILEKVDDKTSFVNEFVTAALYKRILYDRTPTIEGITDKKATAAEPEAQPKPEPELSSKFLAEFKTITEYTGSEEEARIGTNVEELKKVKGAEKVFAAMLFAGEHDMNAGNLGVMKINETSIVLDKDGKPVIGEDGKPQEETIKVEVLAKIDHGQSGYEFFTNPSSMLLGFANSFARYEYQGKLNFNITTFRESVDEITQITDNEIAVLVNARIHKLKQMGFEPKGLELPEHEDNFAHADLPSKIKLIKINSFSELENYYIKHYKTQREVMRGFSKLLRGIENTKPGDEAWKNGEWIAEFSKNDPIFGELMNIEPTDEAWKNGGWITTFRENPDPMLWIINNNKTIGGQDPIAWRIDRGKPIAGEKPMLWAAKNGKPIEGKDPIAWAIQKTRSIEGKDPILWAYHNNETIKTIKSGRVIKEQHPLIWAEEKGRKVNEENPIDWAISQDPDWKKNLELMASIETENRRSTYNRLEAVGGVMFGVSAIALLTVFAAFMAATTMSPLLIGLAIAFGSTAAIGGALGAAGAIGNHKYDDKSYSGKEFDHIVREKAMAKLQGKGLEDDKGLKDDKSPDAKNLEKEPKVKTLKQPLEWMSRKFFSPKAPEEGKDTVSIEKPPSTPVILKLHKVPKVMDQHPSHADASSHAEAEKQHRNSLKGSQRGK